MMLCKDLDIIRYNNVKKAFEFFDADKNGLITPTGLAKIFNPICVSETVIDSIFEEVGSILKENVKMTGISLFQFRNTLLHECNRKRQKLADYIASNRSMSLIKECRELARVSHKAEMLGKNNSKKPNSPTLKGGGIMRSIDSLDELEESDLEGSYNSEVSTPPWSGGESNFADNDLDKSCDSYGVRIK